MYSNLNNFISFLIITNYKYQFLLISASFYLFFPMKNVQSCQCKDLYICIYIDIYRYVDLCLETIFIKNEWNGIFLKDSKKDGKNKEMKIIIPNAESKRSQIDERRVTSDK